MIDIDAADDARHKRSRTWIYLAAAASVLVLAVAATALVAYNSGRNQLRFEVETQSGTAIQIAWNVGIEQTDRVTGDPPGETFPTPWSTTVTVENLEEDVMLMAMSAATDVVTCRIIANGETVAEASQDRAIGCVFDLEDLPA